MKLKPYLVTGMAIIALAVVMFIFFATAVPALNQINVAALQATTTPIPPTLPGDAIPIKPLTDIKSLDATVKLNVNGLINGKRAQGDLNALLTTNDQNKSKITVSGGLLGEVAAQVGGSLVGLFTPKEAEIYKVPDGTFVVVNGLFPVCVKPNAPQATQALDQMSPSSLMTMLTGSDVARGKFVGEETLNGVPVKHYVINGDAFLKAAQNSSNKNLKTFGDALWSAEDADLYIDAKTGHPVSFRGNYSGSFEPLKFEGDFGVDIALTGTNTNPTINLPSACDKPISQ